MQVNLNINNPDFSQEELSFQEKKELNEEMKNNTKDKKEKNIIKSLNNSDIERTIIYLMLKEYWNKIYDFLSEYKINSSLFISKIWNFIFNLLVELFEKNKQVDQIMILAELDNNKNLLTEEKISYKSVEDFFILRWILPKFEYIETYIKYLKINYKKSELNKLATDLSKNIINNNKEEVLKDIQYKISKYDLSFEEKETNPDIWLVDNNYLIDEFNNFLSWKRENKSKISTWYNKVDNFLWWVEKWNMVVFAARPSVWKSVNMMNVMSNMVDNGYRCIYISWELYWKYLYNRWLSIKTNINADKIKNPKKLSEKEIKKIETYNEKFREENLAFFYFDSVITARSIEQLTRDINMKYWQVDALFIDYLGKLYPNNMNTNRTPNAIMTDISKEVFSLGWNLNVLVVTASQLSRWLVKDAAIEWMVPPKMNDLRDSGSIEQDADMVIWITRNTHEATWCFRESDKQELIWHIIKNRNGKTWEISLEYHPTTFKINDPVNEFLNEAEEQNYKKNSDMKNKAMIDEILEKENNFTNITKNIF